MTTEEGALVPLAQSFLSMPASFRIAFAVCRDPIFVGTDTATSLWGDYIPKSQLRPGGQPGRRA